MVSTTLERIILHCTVAIGQADHTQADHIWEMQRNPPLTAKRQFFSTGLSTWEGRLFQGVQKMLIGDTNLPWVLSLPTEMICLSSCNSL